jgi:hypothetical protein
MANGLQRQALRKGARIMGGEGRLCDMLDAPPGEFVRWREGVEPMPDPLFAELLQFLSDMEQDSLPPR